MPKEIYAWVNYSFRNGEDMKEVKSLRTTNSIVWGLSLVGGTILTLVGILAGECVDRSSYSGTCYEYAPSPTVIASGITALLISTLIAQVIFLFAAHVEASHKA
jgi:hypothetical protein